jgi:two-component system OmpR family response regulator
LGTFEIRIVVVGCETHVGVAVCRHFARRGSVITSGLVDAVGTIIAVEPTVVVVDVDGGDERQALAMVRRPRPDVPIVFLVRDDTPSDTRVCLLRGGATEVLNRSIPMDELLARVERAVDLRRLQTCIEVGDIVVNEDVGVATRAGVALELTAIEFELLGALARSAGSVVSKRQLLSIIWGYEQFDVNLVEVHVSQLRRKLELHGPRVIRTVRGRGYILVTESLSARLAAGGPMLLAEG